MIPVHVPTLPRVAVCVQHLTFAQLGVVLTEERFIYVPLEPRQKPVSSNATIRLLQVNQGALYLEVSRHVYIVYSFPCPYIVQAPPSLTSTLSVDQLTGM
jgi:hypothetical protein